MMFATDKLTHFHADIDVAALIYPLGIAPAALATVIAAIGKDVLGANGNGTPEPLDVIATLFGGSALMGWLSPNLETRASEALMR